MLRTSTTVNGHETIVLTCPGERHIEVVSEQGTAVFPAFDRALGAFAALDSINLFPRGGPILPEPVRLSVYTAIYAAEEGCRIEIAEQEEEMQALVDIATEPPDFEWKNRFGQVLVEHAAYKTLLKLTPTPSDDTVAKARAAVDLHFWRSGFGDDGVEWATFCPNKLFYAGLAVAAQSYDLELDIYIIQEIDTICALCDFADYAVLAAAATTAEVRAYIEQYGPYRAITDVVNEFNLDGFCRPDASYHKIGGGETHPFNPVVPWPLYHPENPAMSGPVNPRTGDRVKPELPDD